MNIFKENKYTKWYFKICERSKNRVKNRCDGNETHHILPKCLGGNNSKNNLVVLTSREHFIVHLLLIKMTLLDDHTEKMIYALFNMKAHNSLYCRKNNTSRMYSFYKARWQKIQSERQKKYMSDPLKVKMIVEKRRATLAANPEIKERMYSKVRGKKRLHFKNDINSLTGDARTDSQKRASKDHSNRMKGRPAHNKGLPGHNGKKIKTPDGVFRTQIEASKFYNLHMSTIANRCKKNILGFEYI